MPVEPSDYIPLLPAVENHLEKPPRVYIGGEWLSTADSFVTPNPSTGQPLAQIAQASARDVDAAVQAARRTFDSGLWHRQQSPSARARLIWRLADLMERDAETLAQLDALDNGKPYNTALKVDVPMSVDHLRYYAGWVTKIEGATIPVDDQGLLNYTVRSPIGVCGLIVPWNYPLLMAVWKVAPALAAGNCIILKPAEQTSLTALYLAELFEEAGFPPGVFNVVTGSGEVTGAALVDHPQVDKIGFTGSTEVARRILRASTGNLKRVSLELGGKSPNIVFEDADLDKAISGSAWAIFGNNGQSCTAGSRLYVQRSVYDRVLEGVADVASEIRIGHGLWRAQPQLGPVISEEQLTRVLGYVRAGLDDGGQTVIGGSRLGGALADGYFVAPTLFTQVTDEMAIAREEIFGPVVCAMPFDDEDEVLARANDSIYGLAAGLWTRDLRKAHRFAAALQAGSLWINTWGNTSAASPFGGFKQSGHGREMGKDAIDLYSEIKSVWVQYE